MHSRLFSNSRGFTGEFKEVGDWLPAGRRVRKFNITSNAKIIIESATRVLGLEDFDILRGTRYDGVDVVWARQLAMYWLCNIGKYSTTRIARMFGLKDHTTIMHGRRATEKRLKDNERFARAIEVPEAHLKALIKPEMVGRFLPNV